MVKLLTAQEAAKIATKPEVTHMRDFMHALPGIISDILDNVRERSEYGVRNYARNGTFYYSSRDGRRICKATDADKRMIIGTLESLGYSVRVVKNDLIIEW